ncbi:PRC-barrel domain-containing protein [Burkholderia sp. Ac-20379]|uniref:PRC-barrel domain-containing protein n=1 Tax=Burkholderia sp. Ac-20379 TaxID=2703900 RepID=UPI00198103FB|nr:PRC-barrel domain-containing protein [Burkholderia sp. Ac-20379]MBN3723923.1 PRC-barrel domain containing protein [Burkholderia sp. Ac-20379]
MTPLGPEPERDAVHPDARFAHRGSALAHLLDGTIARTADGEAIGHVSDAILDLRTGRIAYALVALAPVTEHVHVRQLAAVPWDYVTLDTEAATLMIAAPAATVRSAPQLDLNGWLTSADAVWEAQVVRHYEDQGQGTLASRARSFAEELGLRSPVRNPRGPN